MKKNIITPHGKKLWVPNQNIWVPRRDIIKRGDEGFIAIPQIGAIAGSRRRTTAGPTPLTSADFTGVAASGSTITWTGGKVAISRPTNVLDASYTRTNVGYSTQFVIAQTKFSFTESGVGSEDYAMMMLSSAAPRSPDCYNIGYSAIICTRSASGNTYRLIAGAATWNSYNNDSLSALASGKDVKITYEVSTTTIKFWYWNGSSWTQLGATQTAYNILNGGSLKLILQNTRLTTNVDPFWEDIYLGSYSSDYSTQYPT